VKILFLAANPVDGATRLRVDEEIREISHKIRSSSLRDQIELVSEWAVRGRDLAAALLRHQPDIVHFSGYGSPTSGIRLEDDAGNSQAVSRKALSNLFRILKDNIRVVVLNACYAKAQAQALTRTIDFTIGMNAAMDNSASIIFAAHLYQSLAFGRSVKEAFELAVNQLDLEGIAGAQVPKLLVRKGADPSQSRLARLVEPSPIKSSQEAAASGDRTASVSGDSVRAIIVGDHSKIKLGGDSTRRATKEKLRPVAFLPRLLAAIAISLAIDVLRRFLGGDGDWSSIISAILQAVLIALLIVAVALTVILLLRPANPLVKKAARLGVFNEAQQARRAAVLTGIACVIALGLWLSLPAFAPYYNDRGTKFQSSDPPDLSRARESYQQAVRLKPGYAPAHYNLATTYEDLQPDQAIDEYLLAIRYDSRIYPAYNNLARLYLRRGKNNDYEDALNILHQGEDLSPPDENVQYSLNKNLGWANYALKHYPLAEMYLRRAVALRDDQSGAAAHCLLAYVLKAQGKTGVADECFSCITLAPGEKDIEAKWVSDAQECVMKGESK
jgi:tetratricopeptide (TPR) repeat protein